MEKFYSGVELKMKVSKNNKTRKRKRRKKKVEEVDEDLAEIRKKFKAPNKSTPIVRSPKTLKKKDDVKDLPTFDLTSSPEISPIKIKSLKLFDLQLVFEQLLSSRSCCCNMKQQDLLKLGLVCAILFLPDNVVSGKQY